MPDVRWLFVTFVVGCASAEPPGQSGVDSGVPGDGNEVTLDSDMPLIDAMVDAPPGPQTRTLSQTTSNTLKALNSIACASNGDGSTRDNSYYRVFDLPALGINAPFTVSQVSFQIEHCDQLTGSAGCTVAVRVGTYNGTPGATLTSANITILQSNATVPMPEVIENAGPPPTTPGGTVNAPITATIPAGSKLVVQVDAPDGLNVYSFFMGSNDGGESAPGYIKSASCLITEPTNISTVGTAAPRHLLLTVTGTY